MTIICRPMKVGEEAEVSEQLRAFGIEFETPVPIATTPENLRAASDMMHISVADHAGEIIGFCAWMLIFSTWRGLKGMYVSDLYIKPDFRRQNVGADLLRAAAADASSRGAKFIKLEVNVNKFKTHQFYERLGFVHANTDRLMFLEQITFDAFISGATQ
jgi:GNAT superfamily N-acetyltransferase